jgi:hypothetical protein
VDLLDLLDFLPTERTTTTEDRRLVLFVACCELPEGAQSRAHRLAAATIASGANTEGRRGSSGSASAVGSRALLISKLLRV